MNTVQDHRPAGQQLGRLGASSADSGLVWGGGARRVRRVAKVRESAPLTVAKVIPQGFCRPASQGQWLTCARDVIDGAGLRADRRETLVSVARSLMGWADWDTLTTRPTWAQLVEDCRKTTGKGSRRTIARHVQTLIELNLMARVAGGRQAQYAPGNDGVNEAAVYVLLVPSPVTAVPEQAPTEPVVTEENSVPVDELGTPPLREVSKTYPVRASARERAGAGTRAVDSAPSFSPESEREREDTSGPLRGASGAAAPVPPVGSGPVGATRADGPWPGWATARRREDRLAAAGAIREVLPVLRQISVEDVRAELRLWHLAGWTNNDLVRAIDVKPSSGRWPHDGASGIGPLGVRGWLRYRLAPWAPGGTVMRPPSQVADAERTQRLARQQAERQRETARAAQRATQGPSGVARSVVAHARHLRLTTPTPNCPWCAPLSAVPDPVSS